MRSGNRIMGLNRIADYFIHKWSLLNHYGIHTFRSGFATCLASCGHTTTNNIIRVDAAVNHYRSTVFGLATRPRTARPELHDQQVSDDEPRDEEDDRRGHPSLPRGTGTGTGRRFGGDAGGWQPRVSAVAYAPCMQVQDFFPSHDRP